jgi:MatE
MNLQAEATARTTTPTFWGSVWEALRGSHQDYTAGSLNRSIFLLAIPMVLEMVLESLFAVVDVFWVGRLGANAVATVGLTESMLALVFARYRLVSFHDGDGCAPHRREGS